MPAGNNAVRRVSTLLRTYSSFNPAICRTCQETLSRRGYASAAASPSSSAGVASSTPPPPPPTTTTPETSTAPLLNPKYTINAGVVLSRAPRLTRELHPFEKAFFLYQRRLNERLVLPFTRYFYFKRGTPGDVEWRRKYKERQTPARDIGKYNAYSEDAWNDELLVGAPESEPAHQVDALIRDAEGLAVSESEDGSVKQAEVPRPLPRESEADTKGDEKSLDRRLQRTIYLLVKDKQGRWSFPSVSIQEKENLRTASERGLFQSAGPDMNTWMVGYHPVGHIIENFRRPKETNEPGTKLLGEKTFFLKGRILAGQANLTKAELGTTEFKWLAKEEIEKHVGEHYWSNIKNMLADR